MNKRLWIDYSKVREELDFAAVLAHYNIDYPTGREQVKVRCPFHDDDDPSLSINLAKGIYQCFGCDAKGNTLEFVTRMEGHDPEDKQGLHAGAQAAIDLMGRDPADFGRSKAHQRPARKAAESPENGKKGRKRPDSRKRPQTARSGDSAASGEAPSPRRNPPLELQLTLDPEHPFLTARGISGAIVETFGLGYCGRGLMKGRIAIPIHDETGQLVAYAGRWADEELPDGTERYKLPKGFEKSLVLYNLHRAKQLGKRHLVLVEGYWSVFRLHQAGIPVASLMGHSCSPEQAALIPDAGFRFVTLLLDGDEAGRNALPEVVDVLARQVYVRALELPEGEKPDSMDESWLDRLGRPH